MSLLFTCYPSGWEADDGTSLLVDLFASSYVYRLPSWIHTVLLSCSPSQSISRPFIPPASPFSSQHRPAHLSFELHALDSPRATFTVMSVRIIGVPGSVLRDDPLFSTSTLRRLPFASARRDVAPTRYRETSDEKQTCHFVFLGGFF